MRLYRLLGITLELMAKKRVTATVLSEKFEVSVRTIYRDVELINQAGIPVASYTGADGGFELMNGFFLTRQYFSVDDLSVIYTLLKAMEASMGSAVNTAMRKLTSLHPDLEEESHKTVILSMSVPESEREINQRLFSAIKQNLVVEINYTDASGSTSQRSVEPLNLLWDKGAWYLEGYCRLRQGKRYFRVSRIAQLTVSALTFVPRIIPDEAQEEEQGIPVCLRFDLSVSTRVFEQFSGESEYQGDA
ncbi:helix-turn-helix transcriptional regulator [Caldalkalibacillus mannanilyticus]|uniref:helix-turn-helix transcriptional regulator n=1 Tax=Caldalkalibacillus mannanilyticus TaxID=1418 RepID=UPI000A4D110B|nr:WYL domain-containing protein [Caldalkalibacillus mannanilyticus]